ncbi:hypothetical protein [Flavobacterium sp.]|uniref:hypothetical protein n=1 Tax=Flavobacterium sp. TaxID=239 RepID=UPI002C4872A1|nr:hypothetical protein [Flavobacterium sp.]HSD05981.1 hypothetical protein [Flavobacterium sp.]
MENLPISSRYIYNTFLFAVIISLIVACNNPKNEYSNALFKSSSPKETPITDFTTIDCLNESNQKVIKLSTISFQQTKNPKALRILLKIKNGHQKIDFNLKKLTKDNLIIIPKLNYNININNDSIKRRNSDRYIFRTLDNEIKNQMVLMDSLQKTTHNSDLKIFALQSKRTLEENNKALKTLLVYQE